MDIRTTPTPGQYGTKQFLKEYGYQLVDGRYRYDKKRNKRYKTVELIVDKQEWISGVSIPMDRHVHVRVDYGETELRQKVKSAGSFWDAKKKAWVLSYKTVL
ncbi:MAG: hypothetical protein RPU64_16980 [Candidatus Sedimenticola sp. (ex Thyasira tokunagai)]